MFSGNTILAYDHDIFKTNVCFCYLSIVLKEKNEGVGNKESTKISISSLTKCLLETDK